MARDINTAVPYSLGSIDYTVIIAEPQQFDIWVTLIKVVPVSLSYIPLSTCYNSLYINSYFIAHETKVELCTVC